MQAFLAWGAPSASARHRPQRPESARPIQALRFLMEPVRELGGVARVGLARRAPGARRRRCGYIVDDEQRRDRPQSPRARRVPGGAGASAALALLDDVTTSPASRRLASAPAAPGTRPLLILGQAPCRMLGVRGFWAIGGMVGIPGKCLAKLVFHDTVLPRGTLRGASNGDDSYV